MKAEQDYAINHYKGSGEMSDMLDEIIDRLGTASSKAQGLPSVITTA